LPYGNVSAASGSRNQSGKGGVFGSHDHVPPEGPPNLKHYIRLAVMTALMFVAMYVLMYAMVDQLENVFPNVNQFYMAGLMTAPMVVIELAMMRAMYEKRSANIAIVLVSLLAFVGFWIGIREQIAVSDDQFLKSMIPHHAGAVLMCEKAQLQDEEIKSLCQNILDSQTSEIAQMKKIMDRMQ
jgi:hypothetical protein